MKILMVCLGNICRSPIAHGLLQHKSEQRGLHWEIDSAGTSNFHEGELPNPKSIAVMRRNGIDITYQHSRPVTRKDLEHYDLLYVMDSNNYQEVSAMATSEEELAKVKLILNEVSPGMNRLVPDPYGQSEEQYQQVYTLLDEATDKIIERLGKEGEVVSGE